jgi:excinuclease ABC subunit B
MRHSATRNVLSRSDVVVVASVSCIFGWVHRRIISMRIDITAGMDLPRERLLYQLVSIHYQRNDMDFHRGVFRVRGDRVEIFPAYEEDTAVRIDFFGDEIENIFEFDPLKGTTLRRWKSHPVSGQPLRDAQSDTRAGHQNHCPGTEGARRLFPQ